MNAGKALQGILTLLVVLMSWGCREVPPTQPPARQQQSSPVFELPRFPEVEALGIRLHPRTQEVRVQRLADKALIEGTVNNPWHDEMDYWSARLQTEATVVRRGDGRSQAHLMGYTQQGVRLNVSIIEASTSTESMITLIVDTRTSE